MYAEDDAVAKIDGYVIAVAGAGTYIGEKRLVRIESVGRTAASGVLADLSDEEQAAAGARRTRSRARAGAAAAAAAGAGRPRRGIGVGPGRASDSD